VKFVVVSTNAAEGDFIARQFLPATPRLIRSADRVYRFYQTPGEFTQPAADLVGEPFVAVHTFATLSDADAWVTEDARQRQAVLSAIGTAQ
jgi:hypothetical protein